MRSGRIELSDDRTGQTVFRICLPRERWKRVGIALHNRSPSTSFPNFKSLNFIGRKNPKSAHLYCMPMLMIWSWLVCIASAKFRIPSPIRHLPPWIQASTGRWCGFEAERCANGATFHHPHTWLLSINLPISSIRDRLEVTKKGYCCSKSFEGFGKGGGRAMA